MKLATSISGLAAAFLSLVSQPAAAVTFVVADSGILQGANGVEVNGTLYNVKFVDGTCAGLFKGCDATSDFPFQTLAGAQAFAQALLDQVFLDPGPGGSPGFFDSKPWLTKGCEGIAGTCRTYIPYQIGNPGSPPQWDSVIVRNGKLSDTITNLGGLYLEDTTDAMAKTFVIITPPGNGGTEGMGGAVPEPATWAMMLVGFALVGSALRRRKPQLKVRFAF